MREGTDRAELLFLQDAQELGLQVERQLADFVKEGGAAISHFNQTSLGGCGAGERAFDVAEQLTLHERADQGGTIDGNERTNGLNLMYRTRDYFLASTSFAEEQNRPAATAELFHH